MEQEQMQGQRHTNKWNVTGIRYLHAPHGHSIGLQTIQMHVLTCTVFIVVRRQVLDVVS